MSSLLVWDKDYHELTLFSVHISNELKGVYCVSVGGISLVFTLNLSGHLMSMMRKSPYGTWVWEPSRESRKDVDLR